MEEYLSTRRPVSMYQEVDGLVDLSKGCRYLIVTSEKYCVRAPESSCPLGLRPSGSKLTTFSVLSQGYEADMRDEATVFYAIEQDSRPVGCVK